MLKLRKLWRLSVAQSETRQRLSHEFGISGVIAQVLINRGIEDKVAAQEFLHGGVEGLENPYVLKDMEKAVGRITQAIESREKITVYGDYDVDGITATALLYRVLQSLGAQVEYYIPDRQTEGYGLHDEALETLWQAGTRLVLTVDCGISGAAEVAHMQGKLDIIITDHHRPPDQLPLAYAIINPKQPGCLSKDKQLAGVGVAFKLCQALWKQQHGQEALFLEHLDIVALGTVADIVSLLGENRILVKEGLKAMQDTKNMGLKALMLECGLLDRQNGVATVDTGKIGFVLAPRLNAAGRISQATAGVELLVTTDEARAAELAKALNEENIRRQAVEKEILALAENQLAAVDVQKQNVLVIAGEDWHSGVIGIVASRLVEKHYRPVIMISIHEGIAKGSCRSIACFDIHAALKQCQDLLLQFGGHSQAAGLSILPENIDKLRERLNAIAEKMLTAKDYIPVLKVDSVVPLEEIDDSFIEQMACLAPHGMGNPSPIFSCEELAVSDVRAIGLEGKHLKLRVKCNNRTSDVIAWKMGELAQQLTPNGKIDVAFFPEFNEWQGQRKIQLRAHDVRQSEVIVNREIVGQVYLVIKAASVPALKSRISNNEIIKRVQSKYKTYIDEERVITVITILKELELITQEGDGDLRRLTLLPTPAQKLNIEQSATFRAVVVK